MRRQPQQPPPGPTGSIRRDELLTLRELGRRFGVGEKTLRNARSHGLRAIRPPWGRGELYVLGAHVLAHFEQLAQADDSDNEGADHAG